MANPAELLFDLLSSWQGGNSPKTNRADDGSLTKHRLAVKYLEEIQLILKAMSSAGKRTAVFQRKIPEWAQTIFNYPNDWTSPNAGGINQADLDVLESLIDLVGEYVQPMDTGQFDSVKQYLEHVEKTLIEDESLDSVSVASCRAMIQNLRTVLDQYAVRGDFELNQCLQNLLGNLALITLKSNQKKQMVKAA